jgi:hypothetical protein
MTKCEYCGVDVELPFECNFCGGYFCMEHRLPENHRCSSAPARTPLGHWKSKKPSSNSLPKGKEAEVMTSESTHHFEKERLRTYDTRKPAKIGEKEPSRLRQMFDINWRPRRPKKLFLSLKLWFPIFWVFVGLLFLMERNNPVQFYQSVPDPIRYVLYVFASSIGIWSGYRVFEKCDYNPRSDRGIFALKLLSGGIFVLAVFTLVFSVFFLSGLFTQSQSSLFIEPQVSLSIEMISVFLIVLSFALIILSAYLLFKFERRSGIIVYRR